MLIILFMYILLYIVVFKFCSSEIAQYIDFDNASIFENDVSFVWHDQEIAIAFL